MGVEIIKNEGRSRVGKSDIEPGAIIFKVSGASPRAGR